MNGKHNWNLVSAERPPFGPMALRSRGSWSSKLTLVLAIAYTYVAILDVGPRLALTALVALVVSAIMLTLYAHLTNDIFDIEVDARSGKPNSAASLSTGARFARLALFALAGFLPWLVIDPGGPAFAALCLIYALPLVYSAPPVRLKDRSSLGVVSDAVMAHVAPATFTSLLFIHVAEGTTRLAAHFLVATISWSVFLGLRGILVHQLRDHDRDVIAGAGTFVARHGVDQTRWLITRIVFPAELVSLAGLWAALFRLDYVLAAFFALYLSAYMTAKLYWGFVLDPAPISDPTPTALDQFYAVWPAFTVAVFLALRDPVLSILVAFQMILVWPELKTTLRIARAVLRRLWSIVMKRLQEVG